jgi:hypothetical protein
MTAPVVAGQSYVAFAHHLQPEMASFLRSIILENPAQCGVVFDLVYFDARPEPAWTLQANWTEVDRRLLEQFAHNAVTSEEIRGLVDELVEGGDARLEFDPAWGEAGLRQNANAHLDVTSGPDTGLSPGNYGCQQGRGDRAQTGRV